MASNTDKPQPLHPASLLVLWMLVTLLGLNIPFPVGAYVALTATIVAGIRAPYHLCRLLQRSRWLLLSVALIFLLMTPGIALFSVAGIPAPSLDGVQAAIGQIGRLVFALAMLALLLRQMNLNVLIAGLRQLLIMLQLPAFDPDRAALRLGLTLHLLEQGHQQTELRHWHSRFVIGTKSERLPTCISLPVFPVSTKDKFIIGCALVTFIAIVVAAEIPTSSVFVQ